MKTKLPKPYYIPPYLIILGKISKVSCIIISLLILYAGSMIIYEELKELIDYGTFWEYFNLWEYGGVLLLFIPLSVSVGYYGGSINKMFEKHLEGYQNDFDMTLVVVIIITFLCFVFSLWHNRVVMIILLAIPLLYFILIYHFLKTNHGF